jgi:hypothetical protein
LVSLLVFKDVEVSLKLLASFLSMGGVACGDEVATGTWKPMEEGAG